MRISVLAQSKLSRARVLCVELPSGRRFLTPSFVSVGSNTLLKTVPPALAASLPHEAPSFVNTYHMLVQPGLEAVAALGGLHKMFVCPERVLFTDSGGFQVFSLARKTRANASDSDAVELKGACKRRFDDAPSLLLRVSDEGVKFRSYRDGTQLLLTPESSVAAQQVFGSDVILPLDELLPQNVDDKRLRKSFERTHAWQDRSLRQHLSGRKDQVMYGIVHGGTNLEMRRESVRRLTQRDGFGGLAVGGALGSSLEEMRALLTALELPDSMPRHLLGIADPDSMRMVAALGFDSFDSVLATRAARHGNVFVLRLVDGRLVSSSEKIGNVRFKAEPGGLGALPCKCWTCASGHSAGLLHHLFKAHDTSVGTLLTIHNVHVMHELVLQMRTDIFEGRL